MMKRITFLLLVLLISYACNKEEFTKVTSVKSYNYEQLKPLLEKNDDTIYIINFWATWCAPCIKELPYFEKIGVAYKDKNVQVLLVSLDFPKQVEKKLIPFINKKKLKSEVILLDDVNENVWIPAIDESWSGALPATLIYSKNKRKFFEKSFNYQELENELKIFLKP